MITIELSRAFRLHVHEARAGTMPGVGLYLECVAATERGESGHRGSIVVPAHKLTEVMDALYSIGSRQPGEGWGDEAAMLRRR